MERENEEYSFLIIEDLSIGRGRSLWGFRM
jgi:hypothetical protein